MKNLFKIIMLVTAIFAFTCTVEARPKKVTQRISQHQLAEKQAKKIAEELALSSEVSAKFISAYVGYRHEVWALGPRQDKLQAGSMTDEQVDSAIQARFDRSHKLLDIRKKYYNEYTKFLTPKQIWRVYDLEAKMMNRLSHRRTPKKKMNSTPRVNRHISNNDEALAK